MATLTTQYVYSKHKRNNVRRVCTYVCMYMGLIHTYLRGTELKQPVACTHTHTRTTDNNKMSDLLSLFTIHVLYVYMHTSSFMGYMYLFLMCAGAYLAFVHIL